MNGGEPGAEPDRPLANPHIARAETYISQHIQHSIRTSELAALCNLHPVYFAALFRKSTGLAVKDYMNRARIRHAKDLLDSREYKIAEAAAHSGFEDALYFSKVFKKYAGMSPSVYVQRLRTSESNPKTDRLMGNRSH